MSNGKSETTEPKRGRDGGLVDGSLEIRMSQNNTTVDEVIAWCKEWPENTSDDTKLLIAEVERLRDKISVLENDLRWWRDGFISATGLVRRM